LSVEVRYVGHLGNNFFEYALGRILAEELGLALRCEPSAERSSWSKVERVSGITDRLGAHWQAFADAPQELPGAVGGEEQLRFVLGEKPKWSGHGINLGYLLRHGHGRRIVLHGYFQRIEYYHPYRERIRRWFRLVDAEPVVRVGPGDLLVHLRQSLDMFVLDRAIDLAYYPRLLSEIGPRRVYVCGTGIDEHVRSAFAGFDTVFLDLTAIDTLRVMIHARRIAIANSTFSWWGAYLSDAEAVYYPRPVRNFWSRDRSDVDLEVPEKRYHYLDDVPIARWRPFSPRKGVTIAIREEAAPRVVLDVTDGRHRRAAFELPPSLLGAARWLASRREPFGIHEIDRQEPPVHLRRGLILALIALTRKGFLDATPDALDALDRSFGGPP
jgi:hypothetical protein